MFCHPTTTTTTAIMVVPAVGSVADAVAVPAVLMKHCSSNRTRVVTNRHDPTSSSRW